MSFTPATEKECLVVGHTQTREALELELPPQPVLLLGPESTGKWKLARWVADYHAPWYNQRWLGEPRLYMIRELSGFLRTPPTPAVTGSGYKVVVINLNGAAGGGVQNALLKDLEEAPDYVRFILTASRSPLATITSRCIIWRWGALTDQEVAQVLCLKGVKQRDAMAIAPIGRGSVAPALDAAERFRPARAAVLAAVQAIAARDNGQFEHAVKVWGETEDWMLRELLGAAASGNSTPLFSGTERQIIGSTTARKGIALLAASGKARPQVAVRALAVALIQGGST
jgi:hypothetical protein